MIKTILSLIGAVPFSTGPFIHASNIELPKYGFSIDALDSEESDAPTTALMMFLPAWDGFAPNINVNIQPYTESMKEYIAFSKTQFEDMEVMIIEEKQVGDKEWVVEYKGPMQGTNLHFYARALATEGKVYLVTATAKASQWKKVGDLLRKHVGTFKIK